MDGVEVAQSSAKKDELVSSNANGMRGENMDEDEVMQDVIPSVPVPEKALELKSAPVGRRESLMVRDSSDEDEEVPLKKPEKKMASASGALSTSKSFNMEEDDEDDDVPIVKPVSRKVSVASPPKKRRIIEDDSDFEVSATASEAESDDLDEDDDEEPSAMESSDVEKPPAKKGKPKTVIE
ncbi:hypothetical protein HDU99_010053, partial [Rhizoclosmatium hyalinum]